MICFFPTNGTFYEYISNMGNNLTQHTVAVGDENVHFITPHFKYSKREKIKDNELLITNKNRVDPFDYLVSNCGIHLFKKLRI